MNLVMRMVYVGALILVAIIYVATMPQETLSIWGMLRYLIPATWLGVLFMLAKGVLGQGLLSHLMALILVIGVIAFVSVSLSSTGLFAGIKTASDIASNLSNITNVSLPVNLSIP
jgi:prepilin signal peptidase PulO-like enzyme (type II secretory pathway)